MGVGQRANPAHKVLLLVTVMHYSVPVLIVEAGLGQLIRHDPTCPAYPPHFGKGQDREKIVW